MICLERFYNLLKIFVILVAVLLIAPLGKISLVYLENYHPRLNHISPNAKGIILLGGSFDMSASHQRGFTCYNRAASRLIEFVELAYKYPHLPLVFTGGGVKDSALESEADLTEKYLKNIHFDLSRIKFERKSLNTLENAQFTFNMIQPKPHDTWILVTSAAHMARSVSLFRHLGWHVIPYPVDYRTDGSMKYQPTLSIHATIASWRQSFHEWFELLYIYFQGKSPTILPTRR